MSDEISIEELFEWAQDPIQTCAESPVILQANYEKLITQLVELPEVVMTAQEIQELFFEQGKRFTACGANNNERFGVLRKNPKTGWKYLIEKVTDTEKT